MNLVAQELEKGDQLILGVQAVNQLGELNPQQIKQAQNGISELIAHEFLQIDKEGPYARSLPFPPIIRSAPSMT